MTQTLNGARVWTGTLARRKTLSRVISETIYDLPLAPGSVYLDYRDDVKFQKVLFRKLESLNHAEDLPDLALRLEDVITDLGLRLIYGTEMFDNSYSEVAMQAAIAVGAGTWPGEPCYWTSTSWATSLASLVETGKSAYLRLLAGGGPEKAPARLFSIDGFLLNLLAGLVRKLAILEEMYPDILDSCH